MAASFEKKSAIRKLTLPIANLYTRWISLAFGIISALPVAFYPAPKWLHGAAAS